MSLFTGKFETRHPERGEARSVNETALVTAVLSFELHMQTDTVIAKAAASSTTAAGNAATPQHRNGQGKRKCCRARCYRVRPNSHQKDKCATGARFKLLIHNSLRERTFANRRINATPYTRRRAFNALTKKSKKKKACIAMRHRSARCITVMENLNVQCSSKAKSCQLDAKIQANLCTIRNLLKANREAMKADCAINIAKQVRNSLKRERNNIICPEFCKEDVVLQELPEKLQRSVVINRSRSEIENVQQLQFSVQNITLPALTADGLYKLLERLMTEDDFLHSPDLSPPLNRWIMREYSVEKLLRNIKFKHNLAITDDFPITLWNKDFYFDKVNEKIRLSWTSYWHLIGEDIKFLEERAFCTGIGNEGVCINHCDKHKFVRIPLLFYEIGVMMADMCDDEKINDEIQTFLDPKSILQIIIERKTPDCSALMSQMSLLIKKVCAPIRDAVIDGIAKEAGENGYLVCLKKTVEFVELMRLDLLNEFVRRHKFRILQSIPTAEHDYFMERKEYIMVEMMSFFQQLPIAVQMERLHSLNNFVALVYLSIISSNEFDRIPEPFRLDQVMLIKIYNRLQDTCIILSLQTVLQTIYKSKRTSPMNKACLINYKHSLKRLLGNDKTKIGQIICNFLTNLEQCLQEELKLSERNRISKMVDKVLYVQSPILQLFKRRVINHVQNILIEQESTLLVYQRNGTLEVLDEIRDISNQIRKLAKFHLTLYGNYFYS